MAKEGALAFNKGEVLDYTAGADIAYAQVIPLTGRVGVALEAIPNGSTGSLAVAGVWELPAVTGTAFSVGDTLYWDDTANNLTKTSASNTVAGWCFAVKASAGTTALVKIN